MPFFSIIIPVYNVEDYLQRCVDSVLSQSFTDFEVILVDDGSPDNSGMICDQYAVEDERVKVIHKRNGGQSDARNAGILKASGLYILFLDSDDKFSDHLTLKKLNQVIVSSFPDLILYSTFDVDINGKKTIAVGNYPIVGSITKESLVSMLIDRGLYPGAPWIVGVGRNCILQNELYFPLGCNAEDYLWILKVIRYCKSIDVCSDAYVDHYKVIPGSITSKVNIKGVIGMHLALQYWLDTNKSYSWPQGIDNEILRIFMIELINYAYLEKSDKIDFLETLISDAKVLDEIQTKRSFLVKLLIKFIGINNTSKLLAFLHRQLKR